ncbi:zinc finger MYM-type protein 1-like [Sipha flava]|uniref:Zinc finger MYM-type protein 1-like n=1 Tax=Sipha flava TaxID=143950 RepID=A0A8B8GDB6_9HEMI|nr:zinc finger MYM-type protein 1-like [Sipha flava]
MSKRTYLSGSEKRKRLAIQKENISKLPKLTSFFTLEETNRQTEFSTSSFQGNSLSSSNGYKDWKHISNFLMELENSSLHRIVAVVKFLASRGLGFRGDDEMLGSQNNGNYLGCLELISEFHPFLTDHIQNYGNRGKGTKYYSISVDSTLDLSHVDQLNFIVRFVKDGKPIERFLLFLPIEEHKAQYMADTVLNFLENLKIPIKNCREQSYDNAANMAGNYSGLQARIKEQWKFAIFVPCATHSLNLVGAQAVGCVSEAVAYFQFVQKLFNFFSSSNNRWKILKECLGGQKVLKSLSETRWSARAGAINALHNAYDHIFEALLLIAKNTDQSAETRNEAKSIGKKNGKIGDHYPN